MPTKSVRNIFLTYNNYGENYDSFINWCRDKCSYFIIGKEVGEKGTPHLQGYLEFENQIRWSTLKKKWNAIHWEEPFDQESSIKYCMKGEQPKDDWKKNKWNSPLWGKNADFIEEGTPKKQGERTDLKKIADSILNNDTNVDTICVENPMLYHLYGRTLHKVEDLAMRQRYRTTMTQGYWYYGPTGCGKSIKAFENFSPSTHYVWKLNDNNWQDGYTQQDTVIIDDFRGSIPYDELLRMVDIHPNYYVPRRGKEPIPFTSKTVIITSSLKPEQVYNRRDKEDSIEQLLRRFIVEKVSQKCSGGNTKPLRQKNSLDFIEN